MSRAQGVSKHAAYGVGVYSNFVKHNVTVTSAIVAPAALESSFVAPLTVFLAQFGGMTHVINDKGAASTADVNGGKSVWNYVC